MGGFPFICQSGTIAHELITLSGVGRAAARWLAGFQLLLAFFLTLQAKKAQTEVSDRQASWWNFFA